MSGFYSSEIDFTFEEPQSYQRNSQIIRIDKEKLKQWPYGACVSIYVLNSKLNNQNKQKQQFQYKRSSGTLINQHLILTCAHMLSGEFYQKLSNEKTFDISISEYLQKYMKVYIFSQLSEVKKEQNLDKQNKSIFSVQRIWLYKEYAQFKTSKQKFQCQKSQYDIMIIKLKEPVLKFKKLLQFLPKKCLNSFKWLNEQENPYKNENNFAFIGYSSNQAIIKQKESLDKQLKQQQQKKQKQKLELELKKQAQTQIKQQQCLQEDNQKLQQLQKISKLSIDNSNNNKQFSEENEIYFKQPQHFQFNDVIKKKIKLTEESQKIVKKNQSSNSQSQSEKSLSKDIWPVISFGNIECYQAFKQTHCCAHLASTTEQMSGAGVYIIGNGSKNNNFQLVGVHVQGGKTIDDPNLFILLSEDIVLLLKWLQTINVSQKLPKLYEQIYIENIIQELKQNQKPQKLSFQSQKQKIEPQLKQDQKKHIDMKPKEGQFKQQSGINTHKQLENKDKSFIKKLFQWGFQKFK